MASPLNPALLDRTKTSAELITTFSLAITAGNYASGGLAFTKTFSQVGGFTNRKPDWVEVRGISGYVYEFNYTTGKLIIRQDGGTSGAAAPLPEIPTAATPAAVIADTIRARVCFYTTPALPAV